MWSKVERYIEKHKLLKSSELYLVALSGGADSVALLLLLKNAHFNVHAAHCNFHLRGEESDRDEAFCVELCKGLGVELHRAHFDTREYAELHKVSIEMAARELRYKWFEQLREDIGAAGICVAHHRDDSVETVLLNLVRGTGLRGLTGIQPRNGNILRPLLCVSRAEIEAFLAEKGQKYVTDSTNLKADVQRNIVRLEVLPLLRKLNPAVAENIQRTAEYLSEAQQVLNVAIARFNDSNILNLRDIETYGSSEYLTFEWLKKYGFIGDQVRQILDADTGGMVHSEQGYDVLKDRGRLIVEPTLDPFNPMRIPEEGTYVLGENMRLSVRKKPVYVSKEPNIATLDAAKVRFPLTVRRVEEGDWMQPYGMKGRKLLSDLMTDLKMTVFEKRRQLVVVDSQGAIVWAIGLRIADFVAVSDVTKTVIELVFSVQ
ncbi:MAG: tRNA lysidine(34) synthetase TilS [Prevotella sp.]|nr:tRNA lysidine(34) synthetase TilS [Prevotella sp.]